MSIFKRFSHLGKKTAAFFLRVVQILNNTLRTKCRDTSGGPAESNHRLLQDNNDTLLTMRL